MNLKKITIMLSVVGASAIILGCGSSSSTEKQGWKGKLVDNTIKGVSWSCELGSGTTKKDGIFGPCPKGASVPLKLGSVLIGSVGDTGNHIITPQDIVGATDINDEKVIALAVLFQSLDSDGDPSNGIKIEGPAIKGLEDTIKENNIVGSIASLEPSVIINNVKEAVSKANAAGEELTSVSLDDAKKHLSHVQNLIGSGAISGPTQPGETTGGEGGN